MRPVTKVCWVCNKETTGPYFEADGAVICFECRQKMKTGAGPKPFFRSWKGIAAAGAIVFFLLVSAAVYFVASRLRGRPRPPAPPVSASPVPTPQSPMAPADNPALEEETPVVPEGTETQGATPAPSDTVEATPEGTSQGLPTASSQAVPLSPEPSQTLAGSSAYATPTPLPLPSTPTANPVSILFHPLPNALANTLATVTPLPNSLAKTPNP